MNKETRLDTIANIFRRAWAKHSPVVFRVLCDICDNEDRGDARELIERGWTRGKGCWFCPRHK